MAELTAESIFGANAGLVWEVLSKNGPSTVTEIMNAASLRREEVFGALGWLGRENKIAVELRGRAKVFLLR